MGDAFAFRAFSSRDPLQPSPRLAPVVAAAILNLVFIAGIGMASGSIGQPSRLSTASPEPIGVTLILSDFTPPQVRPHPQPRTSAPAETGGASLATRKRKARGALAPTPEAAEGPDPTVDDHLGLPRDGAPAGLRGLIASEPCGPSSERAGRSDCKGRYAQLVPPQDDWSLPNLHGYEVRFGEVVGVEEKHRRFLQAMALMGKPAGHLDPVWGD